jgi:hypothetical protein
MLVWALLTTPSQIRIRTGVEDTLQDRSNSTRITDHPDRRVAEFRSDTCSTLVEGGMSREDDAQVASEAPRGDSVVARQWERR